MDVEAFNELSAELAGDRKLKNKVALQAYYYRHFYYYTYVLYTHTAI